MSNNPSEIPKGFNPQQEVNSLSPELQQELNITNSYTQELEIIDRRNNKRLLTEILLLSVFSLITVTSKNDAIRFLTQVGALLSAGAVLENVVSTEPLTDLIKRKNNKMMSMVWDTIPESRRHELTASNKNTSQTHE